MTTLREVVRGAAALLAEAGVPSPGVDARLLAEHLLGGPLALAPGTVEELGEGPGGEGGAFLRDYADLVARRARREPLQHLTGVMHFRRLTLPAGPGVFVVRPETEALAEWALADLRDLMGADPAIVVDLCTGSGALALALGTERPRTTVHAVELSAPAAAAARASAERLAPEASRVSSAVTVHQGDATDPAVLADLDGSVDLVVANPPYVPPDAEPVDPEVRDHDPDIALYGGGVDGLEIPRGVLTRAARLLRPGGVVLMEHAEVQGRAARALATSLGFAHVATLLDLTGRDRFLRARRSGSVLPGGDVPDAVGEPACLLARLCPECGAMPEGDPTAPCWRCGAR